MTEAVLVVARVLVAAALGGLVAKGWLTADDVEKIISYVAGLLGIAVMAVWGVIRAQIGPLLERVAKKPEVEVIVVKDPALADSVPSPKVVADEPIRN